MKTHIFRKSVFIFGVLLLALLISSCSDFSKPSKSSDGGRAYLSLSVIQNNSRGTINPKNVSEKDISKVLLEAIPTSSDGQGGVTTEPEAFTVKEWVSTETAKALLLMRSDTDVSIDNGTYDFKLYLYTTENSSGSGSATEPTYRAVQEGEIRNKTVTSGKNSLAFQTSYVNKGDLSVTLNFSEDKRIGLVKAGLFTIESNGTEAVVSGLDGTSYEMETIAEATDGTTGSVGTSGSSSESLTSATYSKKDVPNGTYFIKFEVYDLDKTTRINSLIDIVKIYGWKTIEERELLDVNTIYHITYETNGGVWEKGVEETLKKTRNANTGIKLPTGLSKKDHAFAGWCVDSDLTEVIESIGTGEENAKDFALYAKWIRSNIYVSGVGDDTTGDGTEENPFESVDKACELIIETGSPAVDWTIYIMGDVTGPHDGTNKAGNRTYSKDYGMSTISEDVKKDYAKSILLIGATGLDSDGIPLDMINRGLNKDNGLTGSSNDGTVLVINTEVPVTIKNILLKNACNKNSNGSDLLSAKKGGGLYVGSASTVTLTDGVLVKDNGAYNGSGVYNLGTLYINGTAVITANTSEDGGGVFNSGSVYLGYSNYVSDTENTEKEWTGSIDHNDSWRGGGIKNLETGVLVMKSGTVSYNSNANNSNTYGGGIYNLGSFTMTGGVIEHNVCVHGGGVYNAYSSAEKYGTFVFAGGVIKNNYAMPVYGDSGKGGGVSNSGVMYVYGDAVIGDASASSMAGVSSQETIGETCSNLSNGSGGGIYVGSNGRLYMGYSRYVDSTDNTPSVWNKGVCYNYANEGGGGIAFDSGAKAAIFNSGTLSYNGALTKGGAVYIGADGFTLDGTAVISSGTEEEKHSVYVYSNNYSLNINSSLSHIREKQISLLPMTSDNAYNTYKPLIKLTETAAAGGITIASIKNKFTVESFTDSVTGITTNWTLSDEGKAVQDTESLTVSANEKYQTIASAIEKINELNDPVKDYIITLDGEITGVQTIEDPSGSTIKANSIKIVGSRSSNLSDTNSAESGIPKDIINASLADTDFGSALSIKTTVPVTLRGIKITGGHGTRIVSGETERNAGGGLFLAEGATVSLENYTMITENTNYVSNSDLYGFGGGVYISDGAKLIMNYKTKVCKNTGTSRGAGVYVAEGGYLKTISGSGSDIYENAFNARFRDGTVKGGGIYLENNATLEQLGTYIRNNPVANEELGSGIYMCSSANYMISGYAQVNSPNDIYMEKDAQIEVVGGLNGTPNARLTLQSYPSDDEVCYPVRLKEGAGISWTNSGIAASFEITPQTISGDTGASSQLQYWSLDKANSGKLVKATGSSVSVSIPTDFTSDINVIMTSTNAAGESFYLSDGTPFPKGTVFTFTADEGYSSYTWKLDGVIQPTETQPASHILTLNTSDWVKGNYVVYLEVVKNVDGVLKLYSYTKNILIGSN